jgi:hypothetical protein
VGAVERASGRVNPRSYTFLRAGRAAQMSAAIRAALSEGNPNIERDN